MALLQFFTQNPESLYDAALAADEARERGEENSEPGTRWPSTHL